MTARRATKTRRPRHQRPQQQSGPRVTAQVAEFPLSRDATAEPPKRSVLGRRYDARVQARKGSAHGPKLHVRPAVLVRLVMVTVAVLVLLVAAGWL